MVPAGPIGFPSSFQLEILDDQLHNVAFVNGQCPAAVEVVGIEIRIVDRHENAGDHRIDFKVALCLRNTKKVYKKGC